MNESWREGFNPWLTSHLRIPGQLIREAGLDVGLLVLDTTLPKTDLGRSDKHFLLPFRYQDWGLPSTTFQQVRTLQYMQQSQVYGKYRGIDLLSGALVFHWHNYFFLLLVQKK